MWSPPARLPASPSPPSSSLLLRDKMQSPRCSTEELPRAGGAGGGGQEPPGLQGRVAGPGAATRDAGAWRRGDEIKRPQPIGTALGSEQGPGRQKMFLPRISSGPPDGKQEAEGRERWSGGQMRISERTEEKQHGEEGRRQRRLGAGAPAASEGTPRAPEGSVKTLPRASSGGGGAGQGPRAPGKDERGRLDRARPQGPAVALVSR